MPDFSHFDLTGRCAIVTGGSGTLGKSMARGLAMHGASVAIVARNRANVDRAAADLQGMGLDVIGVSGDALNRDSMQGVRDLLLRRWARLDVLVNAAGGNIDRALVAEDGSFFDLDTDALRQVVDLNLMGTVLPIQVFGPALASSSSGSIINVSSMAAARSLSRVAAYGAAKAAVENLTRWLAVHVAQKFGSGLRVNAVAPGFFLSEQNRHLLVRDDGSLTDRGSAIIAHTPMGRMGAPEDLAPTVAWLASRGSQFVTGAVIPVDGGFSAFGGV